MGFMRESSFFYLHKWKLCFDLHKGVSFDFKVLVFRSLNERSVIEVWMGVSLIMFEEGKSRFGTMKETSRGVS